MGAASFTTVETGKTSGEAFANARNSAAYEHGHGGYTGTIAEKDSYVTVDLPTGVTVGDFLDAVDAVERDAQLPTWALRWGRFGQLVEMYEDKWGPALCFPLGKGKFAFAGFASE